MPSYTNTVTPTHQDFTWTGTTGSFASISLIPGIEYNAQLEVERQFALDRNGAATIAAFLGNEFVSTQDKRQVFVIPNQYITYNTTNKTITGFTLSSYNYTYYLTTDLNQTTPLTILVPDISTSVNTLFTVKRKSISNQSLVTWVDGGKLTSSQLNLQTQQLLFLAQETADRINTELSNATDIAYAIADGAITYTKILGGGGNAWNFNAPLITISPTSDLHATTRLYTLTSIYNHGVITKDDTAPSSSAVDILETATATAGNSGIWFDPKLGQLQVWAGNAWVALVGVPLSTNNIVDIGSTQTITGAKTFSSTLGVTGATTLSSTLGVTGATTLSSTLGVTGATTLSSTLGVTGATILSNILNVGAATQLGTTLLVYGATTLSSTLGVTGVSTFSAGSTALPALTTTGDTNTGVYFPAADEVAITVGGTTVLNASSSMGFKNRLINGDMKIDQRNDGGFVTITALSEFSVDRWQGYSTPVSKFKLQRSTTTPPTGFTHSMLATCTATYPTLGSSDFFGVQQNIEGFNIGDFSWGTANAATVTISFWVRSSLTGLFGGAIRNIVRSYPFNYTINSSNTWEKKTITIPGDTAGTWVVDNSVSLRLWFSLGTGSLYSGTSGAWFAGNLVSSTGTVNLMATASATWEVTGVQLEKGSVATSFDYRPYSTELELCYRYYYKAKNNNQSPLTTSGQCTSAAGYFATIKFPVIMRVAPTAIETTGVAADYAVLNAGSSPAVCNGVPTFNTFTNHTYAAIIGTVASGLVAGNATTLYSNTTNAYLAWSAE